MTCAQGLLRLLWGGPEVGVLRDCCKRRVFKISGGREVFQITFQVNYIKNATI